MLVSVVEVEGYEDTLSLFNWVNSQPRKVVESQETALAACIEALILFRVGSEIFEEDAQTEVAVDWLAACQVMCLQYITTVENAEEIFGAEYETLDGKRAYAFDEDIRKEAKKFIDAN